VSRRLSSARGSRGSAALETVAFVPVALLVGTLALQAGTAMWAASSASEAAREAAREYSLTENFSSAQAAASASLPGGLKLTGIQPLAPHGVQLRVAVPRVSLLPQITVTREAVLP
jgi:hypothetical protein